MALATLADLKRLLDSAPIIGKARIKIDDTDGNISEAGAQAFLDAQEGYVYARLGYTPSASALVKEIHGKLAAYHIWIHIVDRSHGDGEIPEYVQEWKDWAEDCLKDARKGNFDIPRESDAVPMRALSSLVRQVWDEPVTIRTNDWIKLKSYPIVPKSELVFSAKDKGGIAYVRDTDYRINYEQNEVMAISGGAIADLQEVYFIYQHLETALIKKDPERVDYDNRGAIPNWAGLFG